MAKTKNNKQEPRGKQNLTSKSIKIANPKSVGALFSKEFSGLNPDKLHFYLESKRKGLNYWHGNLFNEILTRDLRIGGICDTRNRSVANKEWNLYYSEDSNVSKQKQIDTIKFVRDNLSQIKIHQFISRANRAQLNGLSSFEAVYKQDGKYWYYDRMHKTPSHLWCYNDLADEVKFLDTDKVDAQKLRNLGWNIMSDRIDLTGITNDTVHPLKLFNFYSFDGDYNNPFMNGIDISLTWAFLFKHYGLKDWSIYVERFGIPSVIAKRAPFMNDKDIATLEKAVVNFGSMFGAVIPNNADLTFPGDQNKGSSKDVFERYQEFWNKEVTIRVLGQSLTTDIGSVGSKAAADTHDKVRWDIAVTDMLHIKDCINQVVKRILDINDANVIEYPEFCFEEEEDIDYKLKRSIVLQNIRSLGYRPKQEDIEKEFSISVEPVGDTPQPGTQPGVTEYTKNFIKEIYDNLK